MMLAGRTAIITGAAAGIGASFARRLAQGGAHVALVDRADSSALAADITASGGRARGFRCDLTDPAAIEALIPELLGWRQGRLVLVNNAGAYPATPLDSLTLERWREIFAINLESGLLMSLGLIPALKTDGWGRIINIASSVVNIAHPGVVAYLASKMGVIGMTRAMATDLGADGITVNAISPGLTLTPGTETTLAERGRPGLFDQFAAAQPIGRVITPDDMSGMAAYLASDESAMMTGQTLLIDGGLNRL